MTVTVALKAADGATHSIVLPDPVINTMPVNIGQTTILPTGDNGNGNLLVAQVITLPQQATLQSLSFYITTAAQQLVLGLYADASGKPGSLIAQTAAFTPVMGWNTKATITSPNCPAGNYWLAYLAQSNTLAFRKTTSSGHTSYSRAQTFGAMPAIFPGSPATTQSQWSFYGTFLQGPPQPQSKPTGGLIQSLFNAMGFRFKANGGVSGLPAGVTLQAIDGETMLTPTSMSNAYYTNGGFSVAAGGSFTAGKGNWWDGLSWDSPKFFPLGVFFGIYPAEITSFLALKANATFQYTGDTNPATNLNGNGIWSIDAATGGAPESPYDNSANVGFLIDEQDMMIGGGSGGITNVPAADQVGRLWYGNQTHSMFANKINSTHTTTGIKNVFAGEWLRAGEFIDSNSVLHQFDLFTIDMYWFAASADGTTFQKNGWAEDCFSVPMGSNSHGQATTDECARGSNYGNMIDVFRAWGNGTNIASVDGAQAFGKSAVPSRLPFGVIIEAGNGSWSPNQRNITGAELNWGVWSGIIHGARFIDYFCNAGTGASDIPAGIATQMTSTNGLISQLAPVINSPFALGYVSAVSPHGYIFPVYEQTWLNNGIECCVHWYQGGNITNQGLALVNGFYIFATTRYGEAATMPVSVTFTVNDPNATSVNVVGESRSIAISGSQFTDSFAAASTVHIYQVVG